jgi:hypothetical protein
MPHWRCRQDHRDRGKHLRLPSLQIENASDIIQRLSPKLVSEAFPILSSGNTTATQKFVIFTIVFLD